MKPALAKTFRANKTWILLGLSIAIGGLAAWAAKNYFTQQMAAIEAKARGNMINVVVAKHDLPSGTRLSGDNLAVRPIPRDYAHSSAILPEQFERIEGEPLAYPVKSGEMILSGLMQSKRSPTFSARVEVGRRAVTVPVDEINSISGMLEPGDSIDLLVSAEHKGKKLTLPLLQQVAVLATGQRAVDDPKSGERRQYSTFTLDATPDEAETVVIAREVGKITALLRNPKDKAALKLPNADIKTLLGLKDEQLEKEASAVPVLYGGRGSTSFSPEMLDIGRNPAPTQNPRAAMQDRPLETPSPAPDSPLRRSFSP